MAASDAETTEPDDASTGDSPHNQLVHVGVAVGLTVVGVVVSLLGSIPGFVLGVDTVTGFVVSIVGGELGYAVTGVLFLVATRRGLAYLDLEPPGSHRGWGLVVVVTVGALAFRTAALFGATEFGIEPSAPSISMVDLPFEVLVAVLVPASLLVIGPAEELLFRGVLQKYLRETLSALGAIMTAGLLFGVIHVLTFVQSTGPGALVSLVIITLVGFGLGWLYERTGSLLAAMAAHGAYNAIIVGSAYVFGVA